MRILILASQLHVGAAELLAVELATNLNKNGIEAEVASMYSETMEWAADSRSRIIAAGVPRVHFLSLPVSPSAPQLARAAIKLRRLLLEGQFDFVETSSPSLGILASFACAGTRVRHVVGLHQTFYRHEHTSMRPRLFAFCTPARQSTRFYAVSEFVKKTWVEYSGTNPSRVRVIYNSISPNPVPADLPAAKERLRAEFCITGSTRLALCVGRLAYYKRPDVVLEALAPALEQHDLVLLFAGDEDHSVPGTTEMLETMRAAVEKAGLQSRVRYLGHRTDTAELMAAADILVHGTQKEAFGLVLAEAMAAGLPVVSTRVEGTSEVLLDTGYLLVPVNDPAELRKAVLETLAFPPERLEAAKARGRGRAKLYAPEIRTRRMAELLEDASAGRF